MIDPPRWSAEQLEADRRRAVDEFRVQRLEELLEAYIQAFDQYHGSMASLLHATVDLNSLDDAALDVLTDATLLDAFRYVAGPPISADDLKTLADAGSLSPRKLRGDPELAQRVVQVILTALDRRRFPWLSEGRPPTDIERQAAIVASAAIMATQRVGTRRRSEGKKLQEQRVAEALQELGLSRVRSRPIPTLALAPDPGEFCGESLLGTRKADFVIRLPDHRIMAVECKVSNSALNSVKRLNNDAAAKAEVWRTDFGARNIVPAAVLAGVYKLHNLIEAQERGLTLFWAHALESLTRWIEATRTA